MKNAFLVAAILAATFLSNQIHAQGQREAEIEFASGIIDYGEVKIYSDGTRELSFINTGNAPLIITRVMSSCGCLVPSWSTDPVPPGGKETISVKYDTNRSGVFTKTIVVYSNAVNLPEKSIQVKGKVIP